MCAQLVENNDKENLAEETSHGLNNRNPLKNSLVLELVVVSEPNNNVRNHTSKQEKQNADRWSTNPLNIITPSCSVFITFLIRFKPSAKKSVEFR